MDGWSDTEYTRFNEWMDGVILSTQGFNEWMDGVILSTQVFNEWMDGVILSTQHLMNGWSDTEYTRI